MSARSLLGRVMLAALVAGGAAACKQDPSPAKKPAENTAAAGDPSSTPGDQAGTAARLRQKMGMVPHRGPDGKIVQIERKNPWANGERPTREELVSRRDERRKQMMEAYDADGDGQLSEEERTDMQEGRVAGLVDRLDKDRDGKLSKAEVEASQQEGRRPMPAFDLLDTDKDGFISVEEMAKGRPQHRRPDGFGGRGGPPPAGNPPLTK